jgi:alkylation response protein AidB-like acyl-CoA dehydrogenase
VREFMQREWTPHAEEAEAEREGFIHHQAFAKRLAERGWLTLAWPKEYGGLGADPVQQTIFREESAYFRAPDGGQGPRMVGPMIMVHGSEEQKRRFLPPIARADVFWCQGFSEPGAGSDLASLQLRAVRDGDDYVLNGQKIWTSNAHLADWLWLVCRTDPDAPKHKGISILLLDMKSPGVTVRPLVNMGGQHHFNEVFFDNVRVPRKNLVGEENRGWYVTASNLDFERSGIERIATSALLFNDVLTYAKTFRHDPRFARLRLELAERYLELQTGRLLAYRVAWLLSQNTIPNYEASMSKVFGTEWTQRMTNTAMHLVATFGLADSPAGRRLRDRIVGGYLNAASLTIAGGTSEIQRNVIATRGLGLPRS